MKITTLITAAIMMTSVSAFAQTATTTDHPVRQAASQLKTDVKAEHAERATLRTDRAAGNTQAVVADKSAVKADKATVKIDRETLRADRKARRAEHAATPATN